jgi:outer membrane biosynthesis protein TonB
MDRALRNCFVGSSILGVIVLIMVFVVPIPAPKPTTVDDIPDRIAKLILEKPKPATSPLQSPEPAALDKPKEVKPTQVVKPKAPPRRRTSKPKVAQEKGTQGRQKAQQEVAQNLAQVTGSLDKVLDNVSKALPASDTSTDSKRPRRKRRGVRSGRSSQQVGAVDGVANLSAPDVAGSAIESDGISVSAITDLTFQENPDEGSVGGGGSGSGGSAGGRNDFRSNESLMNAVRRYAPGIQYCYDNELKKNPSLRGKLVVSITVLANGTVSEAIVVEDGLGSSAVRNCVLAQIRGWKLPEIPYGTVSFKTPFVFTPPE